MSEVTNLLPPEHSSRAKRVTSVPLSSLVSKPQLLPPRCRLLPPRSRFLTNDTKSNVPARETKCLVSATPRFNMA
jgi:hypothetical protein